MLWQSRWYFSGPSSRWIQCLWLCRSCDLAVLFGQWVIDWLVLPIQLLVQPFFSFLWQPFLYCLEPDHPYWRVIVWHSIAFLQGSEWSVTWFLPRMNLLVLSYQCLLLVSVSFSWSSWWSRRSVKPANQVDHASLLLRAWFLCLFRVSVHWFVFSTSLYRCWIGQTGLSDPTNCWY